MSAVVALRGIAGKAAIRPHGPNGGVADSLDEAKAAFRAAGERLLSPKKADEIQWA